MNTTTNEYPYKEYPYLVSIGDYDMTLKSQCCKDEDEAIRVSEQWEPLLGREWNGNRTVCIITVSRWNTETAEWNAIQETEF